MKGLNAAIAEVYVNIQIILMYISQENINFDKIKFNGYVLKGNLCKPSCRT